MHSLPCGSLGPRIADEGRPICLRQNEHNSYHRGFEGSGFEQEFWSDPIPGYDPRITMAERESIAGVGLTED